MSRSSLFVNSDGTITLASSLILLGLPILLSGRWMFGITFILFGLFRALCGAMDQIDQDDKEQIRFNCMNAHDVVEELEKLRHDENATLPPQHDDDDDDKSSHEHPHQELSRTKCLAGLSALAKVSAREQQRAKRVSPVTQYAPHELEGLCLEATYLALAVFPNDDSVVAAALSLHALVAKDDIVRQQHAKDSKGNSYSLKVPIQAMRKALKRAQSEEASSEEEVEQQAAELQRKGCLLLGALADGDKDMATRVADELGLDAILEAMSWFRYHQDVANWALWAIFQLCYDHPDNKKRLLNLGGIQTVILVLKNIPDSLEVARHGIAVLFDMLREVAASASSLDLVKIRDFAVSAGLHDVVKAAMEEFDESMEIIMMGQEMLIATGYQGEIPKYHPMS